MAAGAATLAALLISVFTARRIVDPIRAMTAASRRIAAGDYGQGVPVPGDEDLGGLAESFNRMAEAQGGRIWADSPASIRAAPSQLLYLSPDTPHQPSHNRHITLTATTYGYAMLRM